jgi:hypothetical protein
VAATILGARTLKRLEDNLGALDVSLSDEHRARLDHASNFEIGFPHDLLRRPLIVQAIGGGPTAPGAFSPSLDC